MQTVTGQFYVNEKAFALGSQILFPALLWSCKTTHYYNNNI